MNRKHKNEENMSSTPSLLTRPHDHLGGAGQSEKKSRAARPFSHTKKQKGFIDLWRGVGQQVNDNVEFVFKRRMGVVRVAALILVFGVAMTMNSSSIVTQAVLHTDDAVLSVAMDVNPDALGFVLNSMDIGE